MDREEKDDLLPPSKLGVKLPKNKENAIMNALNLRIEDRTQDMEAFEADLRTNEEVKRKKNHIKKMDIGKWPLWMKIVSGAAAAAVVALIVLIATGVIDVKRILPGADSGLEDGSVYVPNVVNYNLAEAEVRIDDARLIEQITDKQNSDVIPKDMVLSQNISDGTIVPEGAVLEITVSAGGEIVYIPDVTGMSHDEAVAALQELGLYVDTEETESELAEGYVVSQSADEGTGIEKGTSITLTISKGDPEYDTDKETEVPELVGEDWDSARDKIKSAKLYIYKQSAEYSESIPKGQIMSQEIEAGKKVNVGSSVGVVISLGIKTTYVPDVQYKTLEEAETSLGDSNLQLEIEYEDSDTVAKNHVVRQSIEAGTEVEMQTVITIWISNGNTAAENAPVVNNRQTSESTEGAEDATTPSQEVKPENTASQKATTQSTSKNSDSKKSKTKKKTTENTTEKTTEAETQKTTQAATEKTTERTTEATTEKTTQATTEKTTQATTEKTTQATTESVQAKVSVPTLTGKTESAAKSSISSAGLTAGTVSYQHSTSVSNGYVISQSLSAGTSVEKGSTVNIVVCNNSTYTEYRYRTKSTTTSTTSSSMSGWTLTDTKTTYGNWGSWSGYSTTAVSKNDTTDVETKQETTYPDNPGSYSYSTSFILSVVGNGQVYDTVKWYQQFADEQWNRGLDIDGKYGYYTCAFVKDFQRQYGLTVDGAIGPNTTSKMLEVWRQSKATTTTYYRYRTRTVTTTYYFEKWSAWSSWSTTYQSSSSTKEVETRQSYVY
jgi:beta-lactam-binding protein with PASTA domain